jgi:cysteine desulfurase
MFGKRRVYLDYAAGVSGNPSSPHREGREEKKILEDARLALARLIEVQADDIIFTSGATESNALAILGYVRALRVRAGADTAGRNNMHVLYLPSAHASIVENVKILSKEGVSVEPLPVKDFKVDTEALAKMLRKETVLVTMDAVCGETGIVWNTREVREVLKGTSGVLHVDASQAPQSEKITRDHFSADMLTFDGAKVGKVRGIGVLVAHRTLPIEPFYCGGGQERGIRPGSESADLAREFVAALDAATATRETFRASAAKSRTELVTLLTKAIPNLFIQEGRSQAPHILNLSLPGRDTDYLVALLDEAGFAVSTRSACETDSQEGSRAVFLLTGDPEKARATLRISWNPSVKKSDLIRFGKVLIKAVAFIDRGMQR